MKKSIALIEVVCMFLLFQFKSLAQAKDSAHIDSSRLYALALDANIKAALQIIDVDSNSLAPSGRKLKLNFEERFKYDKDKTSYPTDTSPVDSLVKLYADYWRISLLNPDSNYDEKLGKNLIDYLSTHYSPAKFMTSIVNRDSIGDYLSRFLKEYLESFQLHTTGFGRTGRLLDLLIWKTQKDTIYKFKLVKEQMKVPVVMMERFVTLGWEEYATLGKYYPGGWTTEQALFCVKTAYDLNSEDFLISYLAHEGRHFADYKLFPKLKSPDLEYRAKLVELSLSTKTLYESIYFFINNANCKSDNGHPKADYCVIRDLSRLIFKTGFETDKNKWQAIPASKINADAAALLESNTKALKLRGKSVAAYIKCEP